MYGMGSLGCTFFSSVLSLHSSCHWCHTGTHMPRCHCIPNSPSSSTLVWCCLFFYALSFNLIINSDGISFRSGNDGFICWRLLSPLNPNSSSWVCPWILQVSHTSLGMVWCRSLAVPSLLCLPFVSVPWTLLELTHYNITYPFLLPHHLLPLDGMFASPFYHHQPHIPNIISSSYTLCHVSATWIIILTNLWSSGYSCIMCHIIFTHFCFHHFHLHHCIPHLHHHCIPDRVGMGPCAPYHFSSSLLVHRYYNIWFIYIKLSLFFLQGSW